MANGIELRHLRRDIANNWKRVQLRDLRSKWEDAAPGVSMTGLDRITYTSLPQYVWDRVFQHLGIHESAPSGERSDSDDYAFCMKGRSSLELRANGIGVAYSDDAAMVVVLVHQSNKNPEIRFVNPAGSVPSQWWSTRMDGIVHSIW